MSEWVRILHGLKARGVKLTVNEDRLRFQAPIGTLSEAEISELKRHREALISLLKAEQLLDPTELIRPRRPNAPIPLTARQLQVWDWLGTLRSRDSMRMGYVAMHVRGPLQVESLQRSLAHVVGRHESLRTRILETAVAPQQHVYDEWNGELSVVELGKIPHAERTAAVRSLAREFILEPVNLATDPLLAAKLFLCSADESVLVIAMEHMISDGYSLEIFCKELWTSYRQIAAGLPVTLPPVLLQFPDYAVWQHETCDAWKCLHAAHWAAHFAGMEPTRLPFAPVARDFEFDAGAITILPFGKPLSLQLEALAHRAKTLPALVALTAYVAVMSEWCGRCDMIVGISSNGRYRPEVMNMVGWLAGPIYLRLEVSSRSSFLDLLNQVAAEFKRANDHYDFNRVPALVSQCRTEVYFNWTPNFLRATRYHGYPWTAGDALHVQPFSLEVARPLEFVPFFFDDESGVTLRMEYRQDRFPSKVMDQLGERILLATQDFISRPTAVISSSRAFHLAH